MKRYLSAVMMAICAVLTCAASQAADYKLYFLGGQSNMEGFGFNRELPAAANAAVPNVMIFAGQMALDNETHGGVGICKPLSPGFGTGFRTGGESNKLSDRLGLEQECGR